MKTGKRTPPARRIAGDVLIALALLLTADVVFVMTAKIGAVVRKADYQAVFPYELALCAVLTAGALDLRFGLFTRWRTALARRAGRVLRTAVALGCAVILFFCGRVAAGGMIDTAARADHVVVLGLALENGEPAPDLYARLDRAEAYLARYPGARLILTGGNAGASGRTEAAVMRDILTARGVPEDRLILEDRAANTAENFRNIGGLIPKDAPVVIVTSDYHMGRAVRSAGEEGFTQVLRCPAPSDPWAYGANMMLEVVLDLNDLIR